MHNQLPGDNPPPCYEYLFYNLNEYPPNVPSIRTEANKWTGLASPCTRAGLIAESLDMSSLGGCNHALVQRWVNLDLPLSLFMVEARQALQRCGGPAVAVPVSGVPR